MFPRLKHLTTHQTLLLDARAHLRELQQFPEQWFLALAPFYGEWIDALRKEELADA